MYPVYFMLIGSEWTEDNCVFWWIGRVMLWKWDKTMMTLHWTRVSEFKSGVVARYMQIQPLGCLSLLFPEISLNVVVVC